MRKTDPKDAYIEQLVSEGKSVIVYANGDIVLADSTRAPIAERDTDQRWAAGRRSCYLKMCYPDGSLRDRILKLEHGSTYHGHAREDEDCNRKSYECNDGMLVPI